YMKWVVMEYIQNLIAWGDRLFAQDTLESVNEATQLYVQALDILGPRPEEITPASEPPLKTYAEIEGDLDAFSNTLVEAEGWTVRLTDKHPRAFNCRGKEPLPDSIYTTLYFCVPPNEKLLGMWSLV